jgi:virulence factor
MRIGMIGLGDIAEKAYLPVVGVREDTDLYIATRNQAVLHRIGSQFRIPPEKRFTDLDGLLTQNLDAVFVHTATESHAAIVERLLTSGIHVYVDKPLDYHLANTERLLTLAKDRDRQLMVGFNRRFAPQYRKLKETAQPEIIVMQKNRVHSAENARTFILDDFIHVIDTLLYLAPHPLTKLQVRWKMKGAQLVHVVLQMSCGECTAIGLMHRESGGDEEVLEIMGAGQKWRVVDVRESIAYHDGESRTKLGNWTSVGVARGFTAIVEAFLDAVQNPGDNRFDPHNALQTHAVCEEIVRLIETDYIH